jgi:hypothetical protein
MTILNRTLKLGQLTLTAVLVIFSDFFLPVRQALSYPIYIYRIRPKENNNGYKMPVPLTKVF